MKKNVFYSIGGIVILIISVIAFILPSTLGSAVRQGESIVFGSWNGKNIEYAQDSDFSKNLQYSYSYFEQIAPYYGMDVSMMGRYIYNDAFDRTVTQYAYEEAVKNSGYVVPASAVKRSIKNYYTVDGKFSEKLYNEASNADVAKVKSDITQGYVQTRFYEDNFGSTTEVINGDSFYGIKSSTAEMDFLKDFGTNKRGFTMAAFNKANYPEEEKIKFGQANTNKFIKYEMSVLTYDDEETAKAAANDVASGAKTFEAALAESTKALTNSEGKLTNAYQYQIENLLENKADLSKITDLEIGKYSPVISTVYNGYALFKMDTAPEMPDFESDEIKSRVSTYITMYESGVIEKYMTDTAKAFAESAKDDFEAACEEYAVTAEVIPPFPLNYRSVSIAESVDTSISGLNLADENEEFLKTAFALKENEVSNPIVLNDSVIVIKYTQTEKTEPAEDAESRIVSNMSSYDNSFATNAILRSSKLKNDFQKVYMEKIEGIEPSEEE